MVSARFYAPAHLLVLVAGDLPSGVAFVEDLASPISLSCFSFPTFCVLLPRARRMAKTAAPTRINRISKTINSVGPGTPVKSLHYPVALLTYMLSETRLRCHDAQRAGQDARPEAPGGG